MHMCLDINDTLLSANNVSVTYTLRDERCMWLSVINFVINQIEHYLCATYILTYIT